MVALKINQLKRLAPQTYTMFIYVLRSAMVKKTIPTSRERTTRKVAFYLVEIRILLRMRASGVQSTPCPHFQLDGQPSVGDFGVEVLQSRGTDGRKHLDPHEDVSLRQGTAMEMYKRKGGR